MTPHPAFSVVDEAAHALFGPSPTLKLLYKIEENPFAHEAGVFIARNRTLFITSNQYPHPDTEAARATAGKRIHITRVSLPGRYPPDGVSASGNIEDRLLAAPDAAHCEEIAPSRSTRPRDAGDPALGSGIAMPNGGVNYRDGVVFCAQGTADADGGLVFMQAEPPYEMRTLVRSFCGRPFNSPNDVVVHPRDGSIWFTDPIYGYEQGFRPPPQLPSQVYRFDPESQAIRAMADGFGRPNGICFSPDASIVYITDTDRIHGDGGIDDRRASTIYAFDVATYGGQPFLVNRRLFAMADAGIPDGIKCDTDGNVYSGCGDGVNIWSAGGVLLGKILVEGGVANFCFGQDGEMFLLNEHRLWWVTLALSTKGALLGI